jgi:hypothetical protein
MKPTQWICQDIGRHPDDLTDLNFYRGRATELRARGMRDSVTLKSACVGVLMIVVFTVTVAVGAASVHALTRHAAVTQTNTAPVR